MSYHILLKTYFVEELKNRNKVRNLLNISEVPGIKEVYDFMAKFEEEQFRKVVEQIVNSLFGKTSRGCLNML